MKILHSSFTTGASAPHSGRLASKITRIYQPKAIMIIVLALTACSDNDYPKTEVYTLYSTNFPDDLGRHPIATFDVAATPELGLSICQETAELYRADFENRKRKNAGDAAWVGAKGRYWCEKGRFKK